MRRSKIRRIAAALILVFCLVAAGTAAPKSKADVGGKRHVRVMTWNLYFGYDVTTLLAASNETELLYGATNAWLAVLATDFDQRAEAIADQIESARPDIVGLQEAELYRIQSPGDAIYGGTQPATDVAFDFVQILRDALSSRGLEYDVAVSMDRLDIELPVIAGPDLFDDVRQTDRDVILVRGDMPPGYLRVLRTSGADFDNLVTLDVAGGIPLTILHGWVSADVKVRGKVFRVVDTHLEDDPFPAVQEAQAEELLEGPLNTTLPVILLGDLNSDASGQSTDSYADLIDGGLTDAWTEVNPNDPGLTWGNDANLLNTTITFTQRIDFVLFRGPFEVMQAYRVGESLSDRTATGLWPSDHAGVFADLSIPSPFKLKSSTMPGAASKTHGAKMSRVSLESGNAANKARRKKSHR